MLMWMQRTPAKITQVSSLLPSALNMQFSRFQVQDLGLVTEACFERQLCSHVRARFPSFCASRDEKEIQTVVRQALALGATYGLNRQVDVLTMLEALLCLENPAWSATILSRADLQGKQKAALLNDYMVFGAPGKRTPKSGATQLWPVLPCH
jgi:hypothetical protein